MTVHNKEFVLDDFPLFSTKVCHYTIKANVCLVNNTETKELYILFPNTNKYKDPIQLCSIGFLKLLQTNFKSIIIVHCGGRLFPRIIFADETNMKLDYFLLGKKFKRSYYVHYVDNNFFNLKLDNIQILKLFNRFSIVAQNEFRKGAKVSPLGEGMHHISLIKRDNDLSYYKCVLKFNGKRYIKYRSIDRYGDKKAKELILQVRDKLISNFKNQVQI